MIDTIEPALRYPSARRSPVAALSSVLRHCDDLPGLRVSLEAQVTVVVGVAQRTVPAAPARCDRLPPHRAQDTSMMLLQMVGHGPAHCPT